MKYKRFYPLSVKQICIFFCVSDLEILRSGNNISCQGFELIFPPNAFPDSKLQILVQDMSPYMKDLYEESAVSAQDAIQIDDSIIQNQYIFIVDNDPLNETLNDISYTLTLPIPETILNSCDNDNDNDYGYEIFIYGQQQETDQILWPIMTLIDSVYDPDTQSVTAQFFPEIWMNKTAEFIISCTPGFDLGKRRRRLSDFDTEGICIADPIYSPLKDERIVTRPFSRKHIGVDYAVNNDNVLAAANGTIKKSGNSKFYGPRIVLKHDQGINDLIFIVFCIGFKTIMFVLKSFPNRKYKIMK